MLQFDLLQQFQDMGSLVRSAPGFCFCSCSDVDHWALAIPSMQYGNRYWDDQKEVLMDFLVGRCWDLNPRAGEKPILMNNSHKI